MNDLRSVYQRISLQKKAAPSDATPPPSEPPKPTPPPPSPDIRSSKYFTHTSSARRDPLINRSISGPGIPLYRSESSYFQRFSIGDSLRLSSTFSRYRPESLQRSLNLSVTRPMEREHRQLLDRMMSVHSVSGVARSGRLPQLRQQVYCDMKERQLREVKQLQREKEPPLLTYLRKKASHGAKTENGALVYGDDEWVAKREEKREEKEDFILDLMFKDSQVGIHQVIQNRSILLL